MIHCENCQYYREDFEYDDWTGQTFDYCHCVMYGLLYVTEHETCEEYKPLD
jgi:hypothetical protein